MGCSPHRICVLEPDLGHKELSESFKRAKRKKGDSDTERRKNQAPFFTVFQLSLLF